MNGENDTMYYVHKDYLGSYDVITNETGNVLERLSFDPWGRRRNPENWTFTNISANHLFDRGYTGHEHLDVFSLINMNGRVYDPWLGRFLSPDPAVQSPCYSQSYNRYSYCFNNPLKYNDPSGFTVYLDRIIDNLWAHGGGTWTSSTGFYYFHSDEEAKECGTDYMAQHGYSYQNVSRRNRGENRWKYPWIDPRDGTFHTEPVYDWVYNDESSEESDALVGEDWLFINTIDEDGVQAKGDEDAVSAGQGDNIQQAGFEGGEHLIGPIFIAIGQPINLLKSIGALGSKPGSSIASYTLSKLLPFRSPLIKQATTSFFGLKSSTAVLGRALGRLTPGIGWGMTVWDVSYNLVPLIVDKFILPLYPSSIEEENKKNAGHWAEVGVCFRAGTFVCSTNGFVPIEKIKVGDTVLSYNLAKSMIEPNKVEKVFKRKAQEIFELITSNQKLFVTAQHPFYVVGKGWIEVKDLQQGDMLKTKNDVNEQLLNIVVLKHVEIVYNIEVEGNHNYFITNSAILVHNK
jgi:RHS repeat-associated protein